MTRARRSFAVLWLSDNGYVRVEKVGSKKLHYVEKPLPDEFTTFYPVVDEDDGEDK